MLDKDLQSIQEARRLVEKAAEAQQLLQSFSQQQLDTVVAAMAEAARQQAEPLARLAVEETTYGVVADKTEKNLLSACEISEAIKDLKTVGLIHEDREKGVLEFAVPAGVVCAIIPTTNPTSTALYKALIALKGANAVVFSPHPNAVRCIRETVRIMEEAALRAGAPEGCLACLSDPTEQATEELMKHRSTAIILATGGSGMVRAAYASGKPALGVGPGNVPAYIHSSANVTKAVADILSGKTFDNGTICSSEQHMVVDQAVADRARSETERFRGYFLDPQQAAAVSRVLILPNLRVNPRMVGQSVEKIAKEAGIQVPSGTRALVAMLDGVGRQHPLSAEKLSPVLTFRAVKDWHEGLDWCIQLLRFGGMGHTMSVHANDDNVVREFGLHAPAFRVVINTPSTLGAVGHTTRLFPSMSLGCGTPGGNITSDNISPMHLINIKRVAYEQRPVNRPDGSALPRRSSIEALESRQPQPATRPIAIPVRSGVIPQPDPVVIAGLVSRLGAMSSAGSTPMASTSSHPSLANPANPAPTVSNTVRDSAAPRPAYAPAPTVVHYPPAPESKPVAAPTAPVPPAPKPVDFVAEDDVRQAIKKGEKIYIGPRTILTPSARDLGDPREIFVLVR